MDLMEITKAGGVTRDDAARLHALADALARHNDSGSTAAARELEVELEW